MRHELLLWFKRRKKICWLIASFFLLYTLTGFVLVPLGIGYILRNTLSETLQRKVQVATVRTNPFTFSMRLSNLSVSDQQKNAFLDIGHMSINVDPLVSLFKWGIVIQSVEITYPQIHIIRTGRHRFNFSDLLSATAKNAKIASDDRKQLPRFLLGCLKLTQAEIWFNDKTLSTPFQSTLKNLTLNVNQLDTKPEAKASSFLMKACTASDERLQLKGQLGIQPLKANAQIAFNQIALAEYAPYYQAFAPQAKLTDGQIDFQADVQWSENTQKISNLLITLTKLKLADLSKKHAFISLPSTKIAGAQIDLKNQKINLNQVNAKNGNIQVERNTQGLLNLQAALGPNSNNKAASERVADYSSPLQNLPWQITVPVLKLDNFNIAFLDQQTNPPAQLSLSKINLDVHNLSTQKDTQAKTTLHLQWADQGTLNAIGQLGLNPLKATLKINAEAMDICPLQPYLNSYVQLVVTKGQMDAQGQATLIPDKNTIDIQYTGEVALNGFQSASKEKANRFLSWQSLFLSGIEMGTQPLHLNIREVALTDFSNSLIIAANGKSNIETVFKFSENSDNKANHPLPFKPPTTLATASHASPQVKINAITLQGGKINFTDLFAKPDVHLMMTEIGGRVSDLTNLNHSKADVLLRGKLENNVPIEITGQVNPLIEKPLIDLKLNFTGIDLSPFTPYSGRYLGYTLDKGQLALKLSYLVVDNKLTGQNKILINQLTLGEAVPSPKATKLPIKLALALLKDRKGNIDLDLPVSGNIDNPEFSIGSVIVKMFVNLVVKIISSPFKMLGALFGGGEELAYLDFTPGQGSVTASQREKLQTLSKILYERPELKLEIEGLVDPEKDVDGMRRLRFEDGLKTAKLKTMVAKGQKALPLEQIELTPEERLAMVQASYDEATFPKPRDENGKLKQLSLPEIEKLLYTAIEISMDDLRLLAYERASAAKEYLLTEGRIDPQRVFIVEPKIGTNVAKEDQKSQAKFHLK